MHTVREHAKYHSNLGFTRFDVVERSGHTKIIVGCALNEKKQPLHHSIYVSFYLHARIWHPIVNNKVISIFAMDAAIPISSLTMRIVAAE